MMKMNSILSGIALLTASPVFGQTLNVDLGNVIHCFPADQTGKMEFSAGSEISVMGETYNISDIKRIFVTDESFEDNLVNIVYSGNVAEIYVACNILPYIEASVSGAHIEITQSSEVSDATSGEISYRLSGESSDGSLLLNGSYKCSIELTGLTLTNPSGAAIDVENGKRIAVRVAEGTVNTLADGAEGSQKACLYAKGHLEFKQKGTLNITGNQGHAVSCKEYVEIKNTALNILGAAKDGINCAQYFLMESGNLNISNTGDDGIQCDYKDSENREDEDTGSITITGGTVNVSVTADAAKAMKAEGNFAIGAGNLTAFTSGNGIWDESKLKTKAAACISADENMEIRGGSLNLTSSGTGGKGLSSDGTLLITGGDLNILTSGGVVAYVNNQLQQNYTGNLDRLDSDLKSSPKGIKVDGNVDIEGGNLYIVTKGYNGEGIESKSELTISGGDIKIRAYDDGTNSSSNTYIKGGLLDIVSTSEGDAVDSNGNIYISGGYIQVYASKSPEQGFDAGDGFSIYITGGEILGYGPGGNSTPKNSSQSTQAYLSLNNSVKGGENVAVIKDGETLVSFDVPEEYSQSNGGGFFDDPGFGGDPGFGVGPGSRAPGGWGGGGFGGAPLLISCPELVNGESYTVTIGSTTTTATAKISN